MSIAAVEMRLGELSMDFSVAITIGAAASMGPGDAITARFAASMDFVVATRAGAAAGNGFLTR